MQVRFNRLTLRSSPLTQEGEGNFAQTFCSIRKHASSALYLAIQKSRLGKVFRVCSSLRCPFQVPQLAPCTTLRHKTTNGGIEPRFSGILIKEKFPNAIPSNFGKGELKFEHLYERGCPISCPFIILLGRICAAKLRLFFGLCKR